VEGFNPLTGEVTHLYDSFVKGAASLSQWVQDNTPVTLEKLTDAPAPCEVSQALADLWEEGDIVVAHNVGFDLGVVLPKIAGPTHPLLNAPVIDTMRERWAYQIRGKLPKLKELCAHLEVAFEDASAHDATYDTQALARCMQAARDRGLIWTAKKRRLPAHKEWYL
jgi:DNA polymerase III alpha subunit (gram-positive type)